MKYPYNINLVLLLFLVPGKKGREMGKRPRQNITGMAHTPHERADFLGREQQAQRHVTLANSSQKHYAKSHKYLAR